MTWRIRERYRKRLSLERGTVRKDPGGRLRVALVYPNRYAVGMSNLGFQCIYHWLNRERDIVCERVFLPDDEEQREYERSGSELLTLESQTPVGAQDIVAFSISFENDYPNVLTLLHMARIPLRASMRKGSYPLVVAGGVAVSLNPEPLAPFFDLMALGEGERLLPILLEIFRASRPIRSRREQGLHLACRREGMYVPAFYTERYHVEGPIAERIPLHGAPERVSLARDHSLSSPVPRTVIVTPQTEFSDMGLVELGKGCGRGCRFCAAGYLHRPVRSRDLDTLRRSISHMAPLTRKFGLVAPALGDLPVTLPLLRWIRESGYQASTSSIRGDAAEEELLAALAACGQQSIAIAPEAGTDRLRTVLNKKLSEEQILEAVGRLMDANLTTIKLYFMVGLPTETWEDVEAVPVLLKRIVHTLRKRRGASRGIPRVSASVNCFVPKPHTPFQWEAMDSVASLKKKIAYLKRRSHEIRGVSLSSEVPKWAYVQGLLSLGDRRVGGILETVWKSGGRWKETLKQVALNPDFFVHRQKPHHEILPWDFIDTGIRKTYLAEEHDRALGERSSPDCMPDSCTRCGLCGSLPGTPENPEL